MEKDLSYINPSFFGDNPASTSSVSHQTSPHSFIPPPPHTSQSYRIAAPYGSRTVERVNGSGLQPPTVLNDRSKASPPSYSSIQYNSNNSSWPVFSDSDQCSDNRQNNNIETTRVAPGSESSFDDNRAHFFVNTDLNQKQELVYERPVEVTFIDRKTGIEYFADGNPISVLQPQAPEMFLQASRTDISGLQPYGQQYMYNQQCSTGQQVIPAVVVQQPFSLSYNGQLPRQKISNYVPLSIIVTLCFCWPLGLFALSRAREANRLRDSGMYSEAKEKANSALSINIFGIILGIIIIGASVGYYVWRSNQKI